MNNTELLTDCLDLTQLVAAWASSSKYETDMIAKIRELQPRIKAALASQASKGAGVVEGYTINRAEGHGWYVNPPKGGRWVAYEGTPAADLIAAILAAPSPAQAQPVATWHKPWRVGEFWSSAWPGKTVLMIAEGAEQVEDWEKRGDFIMWHSPAQAKPVADAAPETATRLPNGVAVTNVYEAYAAGIEEAAKACEDLLPMVGSAIGTGAIQDCADAIRALAAKPA